ncbi:MAG: OB-fold nucleic acid binding domain-containing protein, partial [Candidatus Latescibacterota bacterium]
MIKISLFVRRATVSYSTGPTIVWTAKRPIVYNATGYADLLTCEGRLTASRKEKSLTDYCQFLKGVGPARATKLSNLGIENVNDLITHYPRKYYDRRNIRQISQLQPGVEDTVLGRVLTSSDRVGRRRRPIVNAAIGDDSGVIQVVWFNQPYIARHLKPGNELILTGQLRFYKGQRQIVNPEFEVIGDQLDQELLSGGRIVPVYRLTEGLSQRFLRNLISRTVGQYRPAVVENLPADVVERMSAPSRAEAIREMHFPGDPESFKSALQRLKLEELFYLQLIFTLQRIRRDHNPNRPQLRV